MSGILSSATVDDGMVYFGARDAHVFALNAENGNHVGDLTDTRIAVSVMMFT